jgi:hypothetical protein
LKTRVLALLCLVLLCSQFVRFAHASGGSKVTTFQAHNLFDTTVCDLDVHFSWDNDAWTVGEKHDLAFSFEAKNINPNMINLTLSLQHVTVRLSSDMYYGSVDIVSEDVSNQVTTLVWRQDSVTLLNTPRSLSYEVDVPKPYNSSANGASTDLYYWIQLSGSYYHGNIDLGNGVTMGAGGNPLDDAYVSNKGSMMGSSVEDPVWISVADVAAPAFPWLYVGIGVVVIVLAAIIGLVVFRKKGTKKETVPPPPPPP